MLGSKKQYDRASISPQVVLSILQAGVVSIVLLHFTKHGNNCHTWRDKLDISFSTNHTVPYIILQGAAFQRILRIHTHVQIQRNTPVFYSNLALSQN